MKKIYFALFSFTALFILCTAFVSMKFHSKNSNGIFSESASPGEGYCNSCHGGGSSATSISVNATPSFSNNEYIQGQLYTITVTVAGASYSKFGVDCEILTVGSFTNAGVMQNPRTGLSFATGGNGRRNAYQNTPKTGAGAANFIFDWVAPSNGLDVRIYVAGNCVNGDGNTGGDFARAFNLSLTTPTITSVHQQNLNALNGLNVYPNPVQDKINVSYSLSDTKQVKIQLCSITGEVVAELLNEKQENGLYNKHLDIPSSLASGMYFLKVTTDNKIVAQRLVSIR